MSISILVSAGGAPGVTALAVALSVLGSGQTVLVDADPHPAQSVLAGFLRGSDATGSGLPALARQARQGLTTVPDLRDYSIPLTGDELTRRFVPGFANPAAVGLFEPFWPILGDAVASASAAGATVTVDAGRVGPDGPPNGLVSVADAVLVVTRSHLSALAALRLYLPGIVDSLERSRTRAQLGLVVVGAGKPYSTGEIQRQFQLPVWATLPIDTTGAAVFSEGAPDPRRLQQGAYVRAVRGAAAEIESRVWGRRRLVAGVS